MRGAECWKAISLMLRRWGASRTSRRRWCRIQQRRSGPCGRGPSVPRSFWPGRKGALKDVRSNLFVHVRRVFRLVKQKFPWAQLHALVESVASMDAKDRAIMREHMGSCPYRIDADGISLCRRPRLHWITRELQQAPGVVTGPRLGSLNSIHLVQPVDPDQYLHAGWHLGSANKLSTFTTSRSRSAPGNRPAGPWQCETWKAERWKNDSHVSLRPSIGISTGLMEPGEGGCHGVSSGLRGSLFV